MCGLRAVLAFLVLPVVYSNDGVSKARLTPDCVENFHRIFVTRRVEPRTYLYFHESLGVNDPNLEDSPDAIGPQFRIVGGKVTPIQELPYQVLYGLYCGGSLIAPNWVITAAHCKDKDNFVMVGSSRRSKALRFQICAHFIHPLWNVTGKLHSHDYDFQLVLLERPVPITRSTRPIAIGGPGDLRSRSLVSVSGWGHVEYKNSKMQDLLRRVYIPIIPLEECRSLEQSSYKNLTSRMFCAGYTNGTKDSCQGDSGGPVVTGDGKLIGLVSFGVGCALPDLPGVYSFIPYVRDWIRQVTALPL